ncbi:MAG: hypothetical protein AB1351_08695 [Thermoproteota archaeon]
MVKYTTSCSHSTHIFLIASIVFLTVGSGFLARAGMHYSDSAEDDAIGKEVMACPGCFSSDQVMQAYAESIRGKMQDSLQDMILNAGIGIALFSMGAGFSMVYMKYYRNVQPIL